MTIFSDTPADPDFTPMDPDAFTPVRAKLDLEPLIAKTMDGPPIQGPDGYVSSRLPTVQVIDQPKHDPRYYDARQRALMDLPEVIEMQRRNVEAYDRTHGLFVAAHPDASLQQSLDAIGLDWEPRMSPSYFDDVNGHPTIDPNGWRVIRDTADGPVALGGLVTSQYENLSNLEMASPIEPLLDMGWRPYRGGVRNGGESWYLRLVNDEAQGEVKAGDVYRSEILAEGGHGGRKSGRLSVYTVRLICANGMHRRELAGTSGVIKHTRPAHAKLAKLREVVSMSRDSLADTLEGFKLLDAYQITDAERNAWAAAMAPTRDEDAPSTAAINTRARMQRYLTEAPGAGYRTALDLLNGSTYAAQIEEVKKGRTSTQVDASQFYGLGRTLRNRGLVYVRNLVPAAAALI